MNFKIKTYFEGIYSFKAINIETGEARDLGSVADSPNMIVKTGLNAMGNANNLIRTCVVGTDSTTVSVEDTALGAQIASTTTVQTETYGAQSSAPYFRWYRRTFRFAQGAAAGNLAEVGIKVDDGTLFSRALIVDSAGNPTTLSILADEYLDVTYEFRTYAETVDNIVNLTVNGTGYTATLRSANVTSGSDWQQYGIASSLYSSNSYHTFYNGSIGTIIENPSGESYQHGRSLRGSYVPNAFERTFIFSAGLNNANFTGGVKSIYLVTSQGNFQVEFSPAIPKNNYMILTIDLTLQWSRYDT